MRAARSTARLVERGLGQKEARKLSRDWERAGRLTEDGREVREVLTVPPMPSLPGIGSLDEVVRDAEEV